MIAMLSLVLGTLVSEDLTCISAGILVQRGAIDPLSAVLACAAGILAGDVGLWGLGRIFGRTALTWPWMARHLESRGADQLRAWLDAHVASAILSSRFLPGARLPLYVVAGVLKVPGSIFTLWAGIAALVWTPAIVLLTASLGDAFVVPFSHTAWSAWAPVLGVAGLTLAVLRVARWCGATD